MNKSRGWGLEIFVSVSVWCRGENGVGRLKSVAVLVSFFFSSARGTTEHAEVCVVGMIRICGV